jgi:hypothetical protein
MIAQAVVRHGDLVIPDLGKQLGLSQGQITVNITLLTIPNDQDDSFLRAAGILKDKQIDPLRFERELRNEWD